MVPVSETVGQFGLVPKTIIIMIYYSIRQHIKYNGAQLKQRYKIYGRLTV